MLNMERTHTEIKGSPVGIFYNFVVDNDGTIMEGRGWKVKGGAQGKSPAGSRASDKTDVSISAILGPGERASPAMLGALRSFILEAQLQGWTGGVKGHKDWKVKVCPGAELYSWLQDWNQGGPIPVDDDMRVGDQGPDVKAVQEALIDKGFPLPNFGADGDYGNETVLAAAAFQKKSGHFINGERLAPINLALLMQAPHANLWANIKVIKGKLNGIKAAL